jgi:hypothetical protein
MVIMATLPHSHDYHMKILSDFKVTGAWGSVVVKALRYKLEGPGIDSRCRRDFFRGI